MDAPAAPAAAPAAPEPALARLSPVFHAMVAAGFAECLRALRIPAAGVSETSTRLPSRNWFVTFVVSVGANHALFCAGSGLNLRDARARARLDFLRHHDPDRSHLLISNAA